MDNLGANPSDIIRQTGFEPGPMRCRMCEKFLGGLSLFDPRWFGVSPTLGAFLDVQDQGIPMDVDSALAEIVGLTHGFPAVFWAVNNGS